MYSVLECNRWTLVALAWIAWGMQCRMRKLSASISSAAYSLVCGLDCDLSCAVCRMSALYKGELQWHWCRYWIERPSHSFLRMCTSVPCPCPAAATGWWNVCSTHAAPTGGCHWCFWEGPGESHAHTQPCQLLNCVTHVEGVAQFTDGGCMLGGRHIVHLLV